MGATATIRTEIYAGPVAAPSASESAFFAEEPECVFASRAKPQRWATGLVIAACLGTAVAISIYCLWQVCNILWLAS
jgi:hypothetical protein